MPSSREMPKKRSDKNSSSLKRGSGLFKSFSILLILVGIFLFWNFIDLEITKNKNSSSPALTSSTLKGEPISISKNLLGQINESDPPLRIVLPKNGIDLKVVEAPIINGYWETSDFYASHGQGSANPGNIGNMVIFAHARIGLFYSLKDAKIDDLVYVFTKSKWYQYKIEKITSVYPNEVQVISSTNDERLTLYTCSGFADEKRLIVIAKPASR